MSSSILLYNIISWVFEVFYWLLMVRIIFSFLQLGRNANPILLQIRSIATMLTEPLLAPVRRIVKPVTIGGGGYLDLSPIVVLLLLQFIRRVLLSLLFRF